MGFVVLSIVEQNSIVNSVEIGEPNGRSLLVIVPKPTSLLATTFIISSYNFSWMSGFKAKL